MRDYLPDTSITKACRKVSFGALFMAVLGFMISPSIAQVNTNDKYIYISGQLTESVSGAPIPDYEIYIKSDSSSNNGFSYYAMTKTDANGFYWDTVVTSLNDGLLNLSLYDFQGHLITLDRYYRFVWENEFPMFVDFAIYDPNSNIDFQASFKTETDTTDDNPLKVIFRDRSIGTSIKSWDWDFGDGTTSEVQDPEHVYSEPGNYMVTLTIGSHPPSYELHQTSTITKQVQVGLREFHTLGGHVIANYFPIDFGLTYLYTFDSEDNVVPLDTAEISTLGYYYFYALPAGKYITKSRLQPKSNLYGQFMPTYFGNVFIWEDAEEIVLSGDNFECDTWLLPSVGVTSGNGQIIGQINYDTLKSLSSYVPAGDIEILLLDEYGHNLTCGISDIEGYFRFANINYGTYQLYPDVTGVISSPMFVTLTAEKPVASDFSLVIHQEEITFSIDEHHSEYVENALLIYPNPVADQARISVEMKKSSPVEILVCDPSGRPVYDEFVMLQKGPNQVSLETAHFAAGYYQVMIIPADHVAVSGKLLKFR